MLDKKCLFLNLSLSLCIFLLYLIFHLLADYNFIINPFFIVFSLISLDLIGSILRNKIKLESMAKFNFFYDCIAYGITLFLVTYDFTISIRCISSIACFILGILFPLVFYPLNKKIYNALSNIKH